MITLLSIIVLGFFLGMRHATDPDHVIAVTTIVSRQRSIRHAALIGVLWGLGHTITILVVGSAIILFGVVIPARVGLTMEFSVGLMLILLGILNLSGIMRWITETLTPVQLGQHSHTHGHGDYVHSHPHNHSLQIHGHDESATPVGWMDRTFGGLVSIRSSGRWPWASFMVSRGRRPSPCWCSQPCAFRLGQFCTLSSSALALSRG